MRVESGDITRQLYFMAVDATDLKTFETGLATWTVYRSRNGAAEVAYTTPTIAEIDATNCPGLYAILLDEDTTITAGAAEEQCALRITHTGMAPVTLTFTLFEYLGVSLAKTAQAGAAQTITLASSDSSVDDYYNGWGIDIVGGTGIGQANDITDYVGSSRVATMARAWATQPDNTSIYRKRPGPLPTTVAEIQSGLATSALIGTPVDTDVVADIANIVELMFARAFDATKMSGYTFEEITGFIASAVLGKSSGVAAGSPVYRNLGDTANVVSATASAGDRSAVTLTAASVA